MDAKKEKRADIVQQEDSDFINYGRNAYQNKNNNNIDIERLCRVAFMLAILMTTSILIDYLFSIYITNENFGFEHLIFRAYAVVVVYNYAIPLQSGFKTILIHTICMSFLVSSYVMVFESFDAKQVIGMFKNTGMILGQLIVKFQIFFFLEDNIIRRY